MINTCITEKTWPFEKHLAISWLLWKSWVLKYEKLSSVGICKWASTLIRHATSDPKGEEMPNLECESENSIALIRDDVTKISCNVKPRLGGDCFAWFVEVLGKIIGCSCLFVHFLFEMSQWCIGYGCTNSSDMEIKKSWHRLPLENKELLSKWVAKIRRTNTPVNETRGCVVTTLRPMALKDSRVPRVST